MWGGMEITDTFPPFSVTIKLDFVQPFEAHNIAEFTLEPQGDATNVTRGHAWSQPLSCEGHAHVFQYGSHGWHGLRDRTEQFKDHGGTVAADG